MTSPLAAPQLRAVVVDDTPDLRALLCLALESSGEIEVVAEAGNGRDGVERVRATRPDIVLLDLAMPVMDGLEALPQMRQICPDATIVVLSGFGASAMAKRAVSAGADGYLQKGASAGAILDYVRSLVGYAPSGLRLLPTPPRTPPRPAPAHSDLAVSLAPYGVIVVREDDRLTIASANARAAVLLGGPAPAGRPLADVAPDLAVLVKQLQYADDESHQLTIDGRAVEVTLRRAEQLVLIYLDQPGEPGGGEMLRRAIATTAHEIRNPVTVLVGVADTLSDQGDALTPDMRDRLRASVVRQARLLDSMTADLLTAAQAHRGTLRVDLDTVDLKLLLDAVIEAPQEDFAVEVAGDAKVVADPLRLDQMLTNLLSNARKYGAPPFVVRVYDEDEQVVIEVVDHGDGVPPAFRPVLFDEFTRAPGVSVRGTGLGLYVVRSLATAQGGRVGYEWAQGESSFRVSLPRA